MTPSELKQNYEEKVGGHFFDRKTMKFFGDTIKNYGCYSYKIDDVEVWALRRKNPVKHGLNKTHYFDKITFKELKTI